ncbi:MAG TPA: RNA-binding protein, partial [Chromatiaceae bacterium]|nr:RNA-binding protein [Chromatiaceae bacterium]
MIDPEYDVLIKTSLGFERIVANRIKEIDPSVHVTPSPHGFKGLVLVKSGRLGKDELVEVISREVVEADKIIPIMFESPADPHSICRILENEIRKYIKSDESFAVRTTRRGRHQFTSVDVNVIVGDCVRRATGASVNLRYPDKIVLVEIIQDHAYISILPGSFEYHKYSR